MSDLYAQAVALDSADRLGQFSDQFIRPADSVYSCSHSLGLPAADSLLCMEKQMNKWAALGALGWFCGDDAWYGSLSRDICHHLSAILGASENEVVVMNSLTV